MTTLYNFLRTEGIWECPYCQSNKDKQEKTKKLMRKIYKFIIDCNNEEPAKEWAVDFLEVYNQYYKGVK